MALSVTIPAWGQGPCSWHIPLAPAEDSAAAGSAYSAKLFLQKKSAEDGFCTAGPWIFHVPSTSSQGPPHAEFSARNPSHLPLQVRRFEGISRLSQDLRTDGNGVVAHCLSTVDSKSRGEGSGGRISCSPTTSSKVGYKTHPVRMGVWGCCS